MKQSADKPLVRYSRGYNVIILALREDTKSTNVEFVEVKRVKVSGLDRARSLFDTQCSMLEWSLKHRTDIGIAKDEPVRVQLYDVAERFELQERDVWVE